MKTPRPSRSQLEFKTSPDLETMASECKDEFPSIDSGDSSETSRVNGQVGQWGWLTSGDKLQ